MVCFFLVNKIKWNLFFFVFVGCRLSDIRCVYAFLIQYLCIVFYFGWNADSSDFVRLHSSVRSLSLAFLQKKKDWKRQRWKWCHSIFGSLMWVCLFICISLSICSCYAFAWIEALELCSVCMLSLLFYLAVVSIKRNFLLSMITNI